MGRRGSRSAAAHEQTLSPLREECSAREQRLWVAYHHHRTVVRLDGLWRLTIRVRQCVNAACPQYPRAVVPEEAGASALPHGACGLDVIALLGQLRARDQRSVPQMHQLPRERVGPLADPTVTG